MRARSLYTLRYLRDPQLQRNVHRSQNRIESYHQLRAFIAEVSGKKHLTGRTDLDVAISNECGRLLANVVIAYNSILLSIGRDAISRIVRFGIASYAGICAANTPPGESFSISRGKTVA